MPDDPEYTGPRTFWGPLINGYQQIDNENWFAKSFDEQRTITAISGDQVTFTGGLLYRHDVIQESLYLGDAVVLRPVVVNLCRSIRFRSENPSVRQARGHLMFAFGDNFQVGHRF